MKNIDMFVAHENAVSELVAARARITDYRDRVDAITSIVNRVGDNDVALTALIIAFCADGRNETK